MGATPPVLFPLTPHNSHGTSPYLPPGSQAGARPGDKGQLGGEGKGIPVPSSPEAQDFLGSQLLTLGTRRTLRLRPINFFFFFFYKTRILAASREDKAKGSTEVSYCRAGVCEHGAPPCTRGQTQADPSGSTMCLCLPR